MVLGDAQTVQIGDNYLNDGHFAAWKIPNRRPLTECRHAVHHTQVTWTSVPCHNGCTWHLAVAVSFEVPDAARRTTIYIADCHGGQRCGWSSAAARGHLRVWFGSIPTDGWCTGLIFWSGQTIKNSLNIIILHQFDFMEKQTIGCHCCHSRQILTLSAFYLTQRLTLSLSHDLALKPNNTNFNSKPELKAKRL